jgi:hypothetical protein
MAAQKSNAFITARKGVCYLTVKCGRRNAHIMRVYNYTIDANDKRDMRRLHPDVEFDWKKITRQLAEKREDCRRYRSRRRAAGTARRESLHGVFDPSTRTVFVNGLPTTSGGVAALLDAVLRLDRGAAKPSPADDESR